MMWYSALTALYLLGHVTAGVIIDGGIVARRSTWEVEMGRAAGNVIEALEKRQQPVMSIEEWDAATQTACTSSLLALDGVASNPSGLAACYNLPKLDNTTGVFEADLRIYKISEPTGQFAGIATNNIQVGLSYIGATVSLIDKAALRRREEEGPSVSWMKRQSSTAPVLTQEYTFVGQINVDLLKANMGTDDLQNVLVPQVSLNAVDAAGNKVNTTLSSQEATFVAGVFASQAAPTPVAEDEPIQTLVTAPDQPFVLPGLNILIFPIGGIITGVWAILFCGTIAYGTFGRYQFREDFRRRSARAAKSRMGTI